MYIILLGLKMVDVNPKTNISLAHNTPAQVYIIGAIELSRSKHKIKWRRRIRKNKEFAS